MRRLPGLFLILLLPIAVHAKDWSSLYDDVTLAYWQTRYPRSIEWNFKNVILRVLTPAERRALAGVTLQFPLRGFKSDPLEFYASLNPPTVTIPILSVKFFDDLSIAYTWLSVNDYSPETVTNYVAMLKYNPPGRFPGGRYPPPLKALRVPDNALANPRVDELSQKILKSAVVWVLAHELGHIYHRHPGYVPGVTRKQAQSNEEEADRFATEIMRRIGELPGGMVNFFMVAAHWWPNRGDFSSDKEWEEYLEKEATHPFTAQRLLALAARLEEAAGDFARSETDYAAGVERARYIAKRVSTIAGILQDTDVQRSIALTARATGLASLAPRRLGELLAPPPQESEPGPASGLAFHGTYEGEFSSGSARERLRIRMVFHRSREQVTGRYSYGLGEGTISGVVKGDTLDFQWREGGSDGRGILRATEQGAAFSGTWGTGDSRNNGGGWYGRRK